MKKLAFIAAILAIFAIPPIVCSIGFYHGKQVVLDTSNFDNNLSSSDKTLQEAMETLDDTAGGGSGDVESVGDCTSGDCLDGSSDGGTEISLYDGTGNKITLSTSGALGADMTADLDFIGATVTSSTMTGDEQFTYASGDTLRVFLDTNGANRDYDPDGTFPNGFKVEIINEGSEVVTFDSSGLADTISSHAMGWYYYRDGSWEYGSEDTSGLELTTDTTITSSELLANRYITNQGAAGEVDATLPGISTRLTRIFIVEENENIEINPPSGEAFDLDGETLDADDCVDSDSTVGSKIAATRMKDASGTWIWSLDTIRGSWTDTGASD